MSVQRAFLISLLLIMASGCVRDPVRPYRGEPTPPPLGFPTIDVTPQWSNSGEFIAYQRRIPSSDGPPGIYLVRSSGGTPRFIAPSGFCEYLRFSPDDRFLAFDRNLQLVIVDLATGAQREPIYTTIGITTPDWSPDGATIAYQRLGTASVAPIESIGIHLLDLSTGVERPLMFRDTIQLGTHPIWSPQGDAIAVRQNLGEYWRIALIRTDGSALRPLAASLSNTALSAVRRHFDAQRGRGLLFNGRTTLGSGTFLMSWDGSAFHKTPRSFYFSDAYSHDGLRGVGSRYDPTDSLTALFVYRTGDFTGATYHQITHYAPP